MPYIQIYYDPLSETVMANDGGEIRQATDDEVQSYQGTLRGEPYRNLDIGTDADDYRFTWRARLNIKPIDGLD